MDFEDVLSIAAMQYFAGNELFNKLKLMRCNIVRFEFPNHQSCNMHV